MGNKERARAQRAQFVECYTNAKLELIREIYLCKNQAVADHSLDGLHKAGINE
jgi:hypothetical protein